LYGLTQWGYEAEPIMQELGRWAAASPLHDPTLPLSPASFMLSMRTMLDVEAARDLSVVASFAIGSARFAARLANASMPVERGEVATPDLHFEAASAPPLAALFYGEVSPETAGVRVMGDSAMAHRFIGLFNLPTAGGA
ncbi:MAG: hypothetical protein RLN70_04635, partial [Rhodospirillaceae bacterium]